LFPVYAGVGMVLVFLFPLPVLRDMGSFSSPCGVPTQAKFLFLGLREHSSVSRFYSAAMNFFWVYRGSQCWSTLRLNFSCARCSDQTPSRDFVWPTGSCCRIDFLSLLVASLDFCFQVPVLLQLPLRFLRARWFFVASSFGAVFLRTGHVLLLLVLYCWQGFAT
jgi:hypothetical protein